MIQMPLADRTMPEGPAVVLNIVFVTDSVLPFDPWDVVCGRVLVIDADEETEGTVSSL